MRKQELFPVQFCLGYLPGRARICIRTCVRVHVCVFPCTRVCAPLYTCGEGNWAGFSDPCPDSGFARSGTLPSSPSSAQLAQALVRAQPAAASCQPQSHVVADVFGCTMETAEQDVPLDHSRDSQAAYAVPSQVLLGNNHPGSGWDK